MNSDIHIMKCEQENCLVCASKLNELRAVFLPVFIHIRYNLRYSQEQPQERLTAYTGQ